MLKTYTVKLTLRILIFISFIYVYIRHPYMIDMAFSNEFGIKMIYFYVIWAVFMAGMLVHMNPRSDRTITIGSLKYHRLHYTPSKMQYTEREKEDFIRFSNRGALITFLAWMAVAVITGMLYYYKIIDARMLLLFTMFLYVCDLICVTAWCPFQFFMLKNKCCVNCRIFNWDYAMMFTPLIFIKSTFTWSLVAVSVITALSWEISWKKHPERFWHRTNSNLQCKNCKEKLCKIKKPYLKNPIMFEKKS